MRVTGGVLAGLRVEAPPGVIRPAMDRMRESVFGALGDLVGRSFLDLFSGSGVIALEAASRGANPVEAVEKDPLKRAVLLANAAKAPVRVACRFMAAELYVRRAKRAFSDIFCDPPFPYRFRRELLEGIAASPLAAVGTRLLVHRPRGEEAAAPGGFVLGDRREYGRSVVDFFVKS